MPFEARRVWCGLIVATLFVASMTLAAGTAAAAQVSIDAPADGATVTNSHVNLELSLDGYSGGIFGTRTACLVDGSDMTGGWGVGCSAGSFSLLRLSNGPHRIDAIAWDGPNTVSHDSIEIIVNDTTPPETSIEVVPDSDPVDGEVMFSIEVSGGASDAMCRLDSGPEEPCPGFNPPYDPSYASFAPDSIGNGAHVAHVRAFDPAGNEATASVAFTVDDTSPPAITDVSVAEASTVTQSPFAVQFDVDGQFTAVECKIGSGEFEPCNELWYAEHSWTNCWPNNPASAFECTTRLLGLPNGATSLTLRASDRIGNSSSVVRNFTVADSTPPTISLNGIADGSTVPDQDYSGPWIGSDHSSGKLFCSINGGSFEPCGNDPGEWVGATFSTYISEKLPTANGPFTLDAKIVDPQGREATDSVSVTIADSTPPDTYFVWPAEGATVESPLWTMLGGNDWSEPSRCEFRIDNAAYTPCWTGTGANPVNIPGGPHTLSYRIEDWVGNATVISRELIGTGPVVPRLGESPTPPTPPTAKQTPVIKSSKIRAKVKGGKVVLPIAATFGKDAASCTGTAAVTIVRGRRTLDRFSRRLTFSKGYCSLRASSRFRAKGLRGKKLKVTVSVGPSTSGFAAGRFSQTVKVPK